jgi:translation initiation factor IF-2
VSNPKVFEFAKEIGMTPLALMDKIREWHLPVKSHMAELEPSVLDAIKTKLNEASKPAEATGEKKTAARKKAAPAGAAPAATKATPTKAAAPKSPATKSATGKAAATAATAAPAAKPAGTVVRRKVKAVDEAAPAVEAEAPSHEAHETPAPVEAREEMVETSAPVAAPAAPTPTAPPPPVAAAPVAAPAPAAAPSATAAPVSAPAAQPVTTAPAAPATAPAAAADAEKTLGGPAAPARKKEVAIGNSGVASSPAPRRNIIGRMDLSRVQQAPPRGHGGDRGPGGPRPPMGAGGPGAGPRPKGNLRTGFIQASSPMPDVPPTDDFSSRRKDDKRRNSKPATEAASAKPAEEGVTQHFDAAEFRKREMVFQPKKKKGLLNRPSMQTQITTPKASKRVVKVNQTMKVGDLAMEMGIKAPELIKKLMKDGVMATINTSLDFDTISLIVGDFGFEAVNAFKSAEEVILETAVGDIGSEIIRPPVVTIMGHVDHGKTSLLDSIRNANVASGEAGGITQHIGAYQVKTEDGHTITFLDTPGHEAFTAMRARGANVTDIAVIVVAADDGVMPQTAEAISHAKAAEVPMIVAINKMDKPGANPDRIKQQLTEYEVVPEEWGGTTMFVGVSALKKTGIKELLEQIHLIAEVSELKAHPDKPGTGAVIEARLEKGRGNVATILVQDGTVKVGQHIVAGTVSGRVKSLMNDKGERVQEAGPGMPVEVLGLSGTPSAGDQFDTVADEKVAEEVVRIRREQAAKANAPSGKVSLEEIFSKVKQGDVKELAVILKSDVSGSMEAINGMFKKLSTPEVKLKVVHSAVGGITESDVLLAQTAKGIVVGFNVRPDGGATTTAKRLGVEIRSYTIVYELMDDMKKAMAGLLAPDIVEKVLGRAEVRNVFTVPKVGAIAGCFVADGKIQRNSMARLIRDGKIVYEGKISSLKRFKDDAREVAQGFECGIGIENFNDVKVGDAIESFVKEEVARELTSAPQAEASR